MISNFFNNFNHLS